MRFIENNQTIHIPNEQELPALADEVFNHPVNAMFSSEMENIHEEIKIAIEDCLKIKDTQTRDAKLYQVRGMLLGAIDMLVETEVIPKEEVPSLYDRLGLSAVERSRIRGPSA